MKKFCAALFFVISGIGCFAQSEADTAALQKIYTLGEVQISATADKTSIDAATIQKYNAKDAGSAKNTSFSDNQ